MQKRNYDRYATISSYLSKISLIDILTAGVCQLINVGLLLSMESISSGPTTVYNLATVLMKI